MPIPADVFELVRVVMERKDFCYLEWDPDKREWVVGLFTGERRDDGAPKKSHLYADRLSKVLEKARAQPDAGQPAKLKGAA